MMGQNREHSAISNRRRRSTKGEGGGKKTKGGSNLVSYALKDREKETKGGPETFVRRASTTTRSEKNAFSH